MISLLTQEQALTEALHQPMVALTVVAIVEDTAIHPEANLPGGKYCHHNLVSFLAKQRTSPPACLGRDVDFRTLHMVFYICTPFFLQSFTAYSISAPAFGTADASLSALDGRH